MAKDCPVLILRPLPGANHTARLAMKAGMRPVVAPLQAVEAVAWEAPEPENYDGVIITSQSALRLGGAPLDRLKDLPALVVGEKTAALARAKGFEVEQTVASGLIELVRGLQDRHGRRFLRLAGQDHIELANADLPNAVSIDMQIVYRTRLRPFEPSVAAMLREEIVVLLHSASTARALREALVDCDIVPAESRLVAISGRVANAAGPGWHSVTAAAQPTDSALLAAAQSLCPDL